VLVIAVSCLVVRRQVERAARGSTSAATILRRGRNANDLG